MTYFKSILLVVLCAGFTSCQTATKECASAAVVTSKEKGRDTKAVGRVSGAKREGMISASSGKKKEVQPMASEGHIVRDVRTTAYTQSEKDHIKHGSKNALDSKLKFEDVRSAAADWSVYPVGTKFKIEGDSHMYVVDDYGSALVGTRTIDLYKPTVASVNQWGVRKVNINVLQWGSYDRSLSILKGRDTKSKGAVHRMVIRLKSLDGKNGIASVN